MAELKVYLSDELDQRFRKAAMETHGYGRGSISKAATQALSRWCAEQEVTLRGRQRAGTTSANTAGSAENQAMVCGPEETSTPTRSPSA